MYDPAYLSTAACKSAITYLDGDNGILRYGGYPIEQLAEHSTFLEVAYLLVHGDLPNQAELDQWRFDITHHTFIHENMRKRFVDGFHYDAHPMGMFVSAVAALGTFYADSKEIFDPESRNKQVLRLIAKTPTIAAMCYRFSAGLPYNYPSNALTYPANFLNMMWKIGEYDVAPRARACDGRAVHPPRRPRAELRHHRDARRGLEPGRSVLIGGGRGELPSTGRSTVAPTRPSCGCSARSARSTTSRRSSSRSRPVRAG